MKTLTQQGFTLVEVIIVVLIIALLAAIAIPNYQDYVRRTKRVEMMNELQNMAKVIEARKLAAGRSGFSAVNTDALQGDYPRSGSGKPSYRLTITFDGEKTAGKWLMTATPLANTTQIQDGTLTLTYNGRKCRNNANGKSGNNKCGMADEWRN